MILLTSQIKNIANICSSNPLEINKSNSVFYPLSSMQFRSQVGKTFACNRVCYRRSSCSKESKVPNCLLYRQVVPGGPSSTNGLIIWSVKPEGFSAKKNFNQFTINPFDAFSFISSLCWVYTCSWFNLIKCCTSFCQQWSNSHVQKISYALPTGAARRRSWWAIGVLLYPPFKTERAFPYSLPAEAETLTWFLVLPLPDSLISWKNRGL